MAQSTMKAAVHTRYGPPEVVRIAEVAKPTAKENELLVRVHATTVNRTDSATRAGKPFFVRLITGIVRPRVKVLGNEFAGEVEAVGASVTSFKVGDKVLFSPDERYEVELGGEDLIMLRERDLHAVAAKRIESSTGLYL